MLRPEVHFLLDVTTILRGRFNEDERGRGTYRDRTLRALVRPENLRRHPVCLHLHRHHSDYPSDLFHRCKVNVTRLPSEIN